MIALVPSAINSPWFVTRLFNVLEVTKNTALGLTVTPPVNANVRDDIDNVCVQLAPPTATYAPEKFTSIVTVYVPACAITTESVAVGMRPKLQFPGTLHRPPAAFVHEFATSATLVDTVTFTELFDDPLATVIVALPGDTASISPLADTVATAALFDEYVVVAHDVTSTDDASRASGWICACPPTGTPPRFAGTPAFTEPAVASKTLDTVSTPTTGGVNTTVLMRAAAESPTENRAICCASMMFTLPSLVTSPWAAVRIGLATVSPTEKRAICCASMMFTTASLFTSPQLPGAAMHTSSLRMRTSGRISTPLLSPAPVGLTVTDVPPGEVDAVKKALAIVTVLVVPLAEVTARLSAPPVAPDVFAVKVPNPATVTESNVSRLAPHERPVDRAPRLVPPAAVMSMTTGTLTVAPGVT